MAHKKTKYYAYYIPRGGTFGVTVDWKKCESAVRGVTGARFKSFDSRDGAARWLNQGARYELKKRPALRPGIYFDAGTGRGEGVEISVTDKEGKNLLHKVLSKKGVNRFGKYLVGDKAATNNYGELLALKYAFAIARATKIKNIFGDSKLVIDFWSQWRVKRKDLPEETVDLADEVSALRESFEAEGGSVERISGDYNPADLGFHS